MYLLLWFILSQKKNLKCFGRLINIILVFLSVITYNIGWLSKVVTTFKGQLFLKACVIDPAKIHCSWKQIVVFRISFLFRLCRQNYIYLIQWLTPLPHLISFFSTWKLCFPINYLWFLWNTLWFNLMYICVASSAEFLDRQAVVCHQRPSFSSVCLIYTTSSCFSGRFCFLLGCPSSVPHFSNTGEIGGCSSTALHTRASPTGVS